MKTNFILLFHLILVFGIPFYLIFLYVYDDKKGFFEITYYMSVLCGSWVGLAYCIGAILDRDFAPKFALRGQKEANVNKGVQRGV